MKLFPFIAAEKPAVRNVKKTCTLLSVSRSAFYQSLHNEPSRHEQRDIELEEHIVAVHEEGRRTYGAPRVHQHLRRDGIRTAKKRVARLMVRRGLPGGSGGASRRPRSQTSERRHRQTSCSAASLRARCSTAPGSETSPICAPGEGWAYLATVIDLGSRRVVGFSMANHMRTRLIEEAITMALTARHPRLPDSGSFLKHVETALLGESHLASL